MSLTVDQRAVVNEAKRILRDERKAATKARPKSPKADRGRERDNGYLAFLRRQPCACCGYPAPSDAAHIRMASPERGKLPTGMQVKPSDRFAVPLNRSCHMTQHAGSEARFWSDRRLDPFDIADRLYAEYRGDRTTTDSAVGMSPASGECTQNGDGGPSKKSLRTGGGEG